MNLYLVQHGKAKSKEEDPERSLTKVGLEEVRKVGTFVAKNGGNHPDSVYHSGKTRAQETAQTLAEVMAAGRGVKESDGLKPMDDPAIWAERIGQAEEDTMLVGHLPHMSKLAALLVSGDAEQQVVDFQNAGVVCLESNGEHEWAVRWAVTPELIS